MSEGQVAAFCFGKFMTPWGSVILAAGKGTRMRSRIPKVLHAIAGRQMLLHVADAVAEVNPRLAVVVVGPEGSEVGQLLENGVELVTQEERLGTGHALAQSRPLLEGQVEQVLVMNGDMPLVSGRTLNRLMEHHLATEAVMTLMTCRTPDATGLGRVIRNGRGQFVRITEDVEATPEELEIREVCCGVYCFHGPWLWPTLEGLPAHGNGEYYLTDLAQEATSNGHRVETLSPEDPQEAIGVNDRQDLARVTSILYQRARERWMAQGVTLLDPASTFIDSTVEIGIDTTIHPNTTLQGSTRIGEDCQIGPQSIIIDADIGDQCRIKASVIEESTLERGVEVGPFNHIRSGSNLEAGVHLGNYVEVKKSRLGQGTRVGHFTYLGDATLGANVNIGAGTVTCNYDGVRKNPTIIGEGAFIGCDSMLVAPVTIGPRAVTGAGAVVTHDVPPDTLVVGMPARVVKKDGGELSEGEEGES
ncbi:MAG: bifunctional UDP-N-acetylglucosamine diphosphorylase/glucosamine-1-phosphate N-acetyltransferase GlmU [Dehalococcoidia bacterium]